MRHVTQLRRSLTSSLQLDSRSLALFRILIAVVVIIDCATRLTLVDAFMGSGGLPNPADPTLFPAWLWSLHRLHGSTNAAIALLVLQIAMAIPVLLGWRSRVAFAALTLLTLSLHNGNPYILDGGDRCLIVMMIWACFLPLGRSWSLDARRLNARQGALAGTTVTGLAAAVFTLQIVAIYWITVRHKSVEHWLIQRDAVWYALNLDQFANRFGAWAAQVRPFTTLSSASTYVIQVLAPLALLWPTRRWPIRMGAIALLAAMHLGFIPFLELGLFPWINLTGLVALIPGQFWTVLTGQQWRRQLSGAQHQPYPVLARLERPLLLLLVGLALTTAISDQPGGVPANLEPIKALGIHQHWRMFAPLPNPVETWFELVDATPTTVASASGATRLVVPSLKRFSGAGNPRRQGHRLHTQRWRKAIDNLATHRERISLARSYVRHLCLQARRTGTPAPKHLWRLDLIEEPTGPLGQPPAPLQRTTVLHLRCG